MRPENRTQDNYSLVASRLGFSNPAFYHINYSQINYANVGSIGSNLESYASGNGTMGDVIIDFGSVQNAPSFASLMHKVIYLHRVLSSKGHKVVLMDMQPSVQNKFETMGFDEILNVVNSEL